MVVHCAIHLDREPPVFSPGEIVEGVIVISSTWADKISGINIKLAKKLEVNWDTHKLYERSKVSSVDDVSFVTECEILDQHYHPPDSSSSSSSSIASSSTSLSNFVSKRGIIITRGVTHRYPFLLKISYDLDLPSSFSGTYGYIAYKLVAFIKSPKKGTSVYIGALKDVGISPILDLNHLDISLQRSADAKRVYKSLFGYNYVFMKAHLDKKAFLPEDPVAFTVEVTNKSPATLDGVEVHLNMSTHFSIKGSSKIESVNMLRIRGPSIGQGEHGIWSHSFNFPPALPTGLGALSKTTSKYIDVQYTITFSLEVSKAEKFSIPFPIVIGTVPFGRRVCIHHLHLHNHPPLPNLSGEAAVTESQDYHNQGHRWHANHSGSQAHRHRHRHYGGQQYEYHPQEFEIQRPPADDDCDSVGSGGSRRPRSKSTSSLPPSYSSTNLHYHASLLRKAETPPPTYVEAKTMTVLRSP